MFCNYLYISLLKYMFFVYEKRVDPLRGMPFSSTIIFALINIVVYER